jgi:hypothetical protein
LKGDFAEPVDELTAGTDREQLVSELLDALEERGVPSGAWLIDIARVRQDLQAADNLLRRLEDAIIRSANPSPLEPR